MLENINLNKKLSREDYKRVLPTCSSASTTWRNLLGQRRSSIVVFEGWDASGKGTAIAALTAAARSARLQALPHHRAAHLRAAAAWLWRFWLKVPNRGEMVIFDHSWYGRVLDERVDRTVPEKAWRQAYRTSSNSSACWPTMAPSFSNSSSTSARRNRRSASRPSRPTRSKPGASPTADWARHKKYDHTWRPSRRCWS